MLIVFNLNNYDPRGSPILPSLHRTLSITTRGSRGVSTISVIDDQQPTERGGESDRDILISRSHSIFKTARPYPPPPALCILPCNQVLFPPKSTSAVHFRIPL